MAGSPTGSIGSTRFEIIVDTQKFGEDLRKAEASARASASKINVEATRASRTLGSSLASGFQSAARGVGGLLDSVATLKGALVSLGAVQFARFVVAEMSQAQVAAAKLDAAIAATGGSSAVTAAEAKNLAAALSDLSGVDDDVIVGAEALLVGFDKIGRETFPRALQAALDLSVLMDGDLKGAVLAVGKALQDPEEGVSALNRQFRFLSDEEQEQIKNLVELGRTAEAQAIILGNLEERVKGQAVAYRETLPGALQAAQTSLGNFTTELAGAVNLTGAVNDLADALLYLANNAAAIARNRETLAIILERGRLAGATRGGFLGMAQRGIQSFIGGTGGDILQALGVPGADIAQGAMNLSPGDIVRSRGQARIDQSEANRRATEARIASGMPQVVRPPPRPPPRGGPPTNTSSPSSARTPPPAPAPMPETSASRFLFDRPGPGLFGPDAFSRGFAREGFQFGGDIGPSSRLREGLGRFNLMSGGGRITPSRPLSVEEEFGNIRRGRDFARATSPSSQDFFGRDIQSDPFAVFGGDISVGRRGGRTTIKTAEANVERFSQTTTRMFKGLEENAEAFGSTLEGSIHDAVESGKVDFEALGQSFLEDFLQIAVRSLLVDPSVASLKTLLPFARGGIVDRATVFPMARGFGLMGEAGPEAIMPLSRGRGGALGVRAEGAGGNVSVNVIDQRGQGAPVEVASRQGPDGSRMIEILVRDTVNKTINAGGFDRALGSNFGLRRAGVSR